MSSAYTPSPDPFASAADLLQDVLAVSLTALNLLRPLYGPDNELVDFAVDYLNPAAQRMTGLPERPGGTMRERFPDTFANGVFTMYRRVFETGEAGRHDFNYQADGFDNYFQVAARRSGERLVVSFTDTADQPRTVLEEALRQSQAGERAARAEAEQRQRELQRYFEQAPVGACLMQGPEFVVEMVNQLDAEMMGSTPAHLLGRPLFEAVPAARNQGFEQMLQQVFQGETVVFAELPVMLDRAHLGLPDQAYFRVTYQPWRDAIEQITGILAVAVEVTDQVRARQQAEQLNQELEARVDERTQALHQAQAEALATARSEAEARTVLYQVFEETPALICILRGPEHRYDYFNAAYQRQFAGRDLAGRSVAEALPEAAAQGFVALLDRVYQTGETYFGQELPLALDQPGDAPAKPAYYNLTYQAYRENGQTVGISVFAYDVTGQVLARQARQAQQHLVETVFAQAPVAVWVTQGPDYVFELVNPRMSDFMGFPADQMVGRPYFEVMAEFVDQGVPALLQRAWEQGEPIYLHEFAVKMPYDAPDEVSYFTMVIQPLRDETGQISHLACVATEATDQVRARQQVQVLNEELAAINEELTATNEELHESNTHLGRTNVDLDNFIYTASHDLKAPISNIEGLLYLLREELPADVAQAEHVAPTLTRMLDAVERFKRTIYHLTEVSKLQKEHTRGAAPVDLATVVEDVRQDLAPLLQETQAQLTVAVADFPAVQFSEKNLRSVVYNLLSNALKYRHPDRRPHVDVRAHVQPGFTVLEVHDNGLGLDAAQLPRLFTMFQRFHTHVEGTGIGLFMVKRMVDNAGGHIEVRSQPGTGTSFFVHLPHAPAAPPPPSALS